MSDDPSNLPPDHPWAKYYQDRDKARPAMTRIQRAAKPEPAPTTHGNSSQGSAPRPSIYDELTAAVSALEQEIGSQPSTFISAKQREEMELAARRENRRKLLVAAVLALTGLVALHFIIVNTVVREPGSAQLAAKANQTAPEILRLYSSEEQPLELAGATAEVRERIDSDDLSCVIAVTLRLREPLLEPADSNGTDLYRSHAAAIPLVEAEAARHGLYTDGAAHVPPVLPRVLRTAHRAGETLVVRVPLAAHRFGWSWSFSAPELERRRASRTLAGAVLARQGGGPILLLDSPDALAELRALTRQAKEYLEHVGRDLEALNLTATPHNP